MVSFRLREACSPVALGQRCRDRQVQAQRTSAGLDKPTLDRECCSAEELAEFFRCR